MAVKSIRRIFSPFILAFFAALPVAHAQEAVFPVQCNPGVNCFILSYPDMDRAEGVAKDYTCGPAAKDGDGALRIGMLSVGALHNDIEVLATRAGKVTEAVDGARDLVISNRRELRKGASLCGNAVVIDHGMGVQSAYCHLREGSVRVKPGQRVQAGDVIGLVGLSGYTTWPQLGFTMQSSGILVDPISSMSQLEGCGFKPRPLIPLPPQFKDYNPATIVGIGFSTTEVSADDMVLGTARTVGVLDPDEPSINLWAMILGVRKGDEIEIRMRGTTGRTFEYQTITAQADEDRTPINIDRVRGYAPWRSGVYTGEITLTRTVNTKPYKVMRKIQMVVK